MTRTVPPPAPDTYTFAQVAVITVQVTTDRGEAAARQQASAVRSVSVQVTGEDFESGCELPPGTEIDVTSVTPAGPASLTAAASADGQPIVVTAAAAAELARLTTAWQAAMDGPSGDDEHKAAAVLARFAAALLPAPAPVPTA